MVSAGRAPPILARSPLAHPAVVRCTDRRAGGVIAYQRFSVLWAVIWTVGRASASRSGARRRSAARRSSRRTRWIARGRVRALRRRSAARRSTGRTVSGITELVTGSERVRRRDGPPGGPWQGRGGAERDHSRGCSGGHGTMYSDTFRDRTRSRRRMTAITESAVLDALRAVQEPELGRDIVTLEMVKSIAIDDSRVAFTIELTTPACPLKDEIEHNAKT